MTEGEIKPAEGSTEQRVENLRYDLDQTLKTIKDLIGKNDSRAELSANLQAAVIIRRRIEDILNKSNANTASTGTLFRCADGYTEFGTK